MRTRYLRRNCIAVALCGALLLPPVTVNANSGDVKERVVIQVGAPSVWSLGQAHYLLTKMHRDNRKLATKMPGDDALDPNAISATRIQLLKTLLDIQGQFDQKLGVENRAKLREYERKLTDRDAARTELISVTAQLQVLDAELAAGKKDLARKQVEIEQKKISPSTPRSTLAGTPEEVKQLEQEIAVLQADIDLKDKQRTELAARKSTLETQASAGVDVSGLANVDLGSGAQLPNLSNPGGFLEKALGKVDVPRLAATIALDNFIGMQYEIIAKQLTLLRDEVGRDQRIVFLELPASVYSVDGKGDDYVAQVRWEVKYYAEASKAEDKGAYQNERDQKKNQQDDACAPAEGEKATRFSIVQQLREAKQKSNDDPDCRCTLKEGALCWKGANPSYVRALDIIPHQSSLVVNDVQATANNWNFSGLLKLLSGFGLKLNYQRQKELYEQFLQQETFAAGFGKGLSTFGWTFGPQPGKKRIAPGVRTMYAVLVVPQRTKALRLTTAGIAYHRKKAPNFEWGTEQDALDSASPKEFDVIVPSVATSAWHADYVNYTSAPAGEPVTVVIRGEGFSSQTGVLVNDVPLRSVHSIGNSAVAEAGEDNATTSGIRGQFEVVNARQIVMKFAMGDDKYVGTPTITIVAPEKSAAINFYEMEEVNGRDRSSLFDFSIIEPMFIEKFNLTEKLTVIDDNVPIDSRKFVKAKLKGDGLRRGADVWIGNRKINYKRRCEFDKVEECLRDYCDQEFVTQTDTKEYFLYFQHPGTDKWPVRYRQQTVRGFDIEEFEHVNKSPSKAALGLVEVFRYTPNPRTERATIEFRFWGKNAPDEAELIPLGIRKVGREFYLESNKDGEEAWRATFNIGYEDVGTSRIERDKVSVKVTRTVDGASVIRTANLDLPLRPQIRSLTISLPPVPDEQGSVITIHGINMQNVAEVFIANQKATVLVPPGNDSITVRLGKGVFIREEKGIKIPVTLVTKDGQSVSAIVTLGEPATESPQKTKGSRAKSSKRARP